MTVRGGVQRWLLVTCVALLALWLQPAYAQGGGEVPVIYGCQSSWGTVNYFDRACSSPESYCIASAKRQGIGYFGGIHVSRGGDFYCDYGDHYSPVAYHGLPGDARCGPNATMVHEITGRPHCMCVAGTSPVEDQCRPPQPITVVLSGPTSAKEGGGPFSVIATVSQYGPKANVEVSFVTRLGAGGSYTRLSGPYTDDSGRVLLQYTPPTVAQGTGTTSVDALRADCAGCDNAANLAVAVARTPLPGSGGSGDAAGGTDASDDPGQCSRHPIALTSGTKVYAHTDWQDGGAHPLSLTRHYASRWASAPTAGLGNAWAHNHAHRVTGLGAARVRTVYFGEGGSSQFANMAPYYVVDPSGGDVGGIWSCAPGQWCPQPPPLLPDPLPVPQWQAVGSTDTMTDTAEGMLLQRDDGSRWLFDASTGQVLSVTRRNGWRYQYSYAAGRLVQISNAFGRALQFSYDAAGRLAGVMAPDGQASTYGYDAAGRLIRAQHPDGSATTYAYEDARWPQAITGVYDETNHRWSSVAYDGLGRATLSELAGGAGRTSVTYGAGGAANGAASTAVTDALGFTRSYQYQAMTGAASGLRTSGASAPQNGNSIASQTFDANSLLASRTDFAGITTLYTWDPARRLKTGETRAAGLPEAQTVQTEWHATLRLPAKVIEPGRSTAYSYDELGNTTSETVTDLVTGEVRTWRWTYDARQLVASHTEPGGAVWTYTHGPLGLPTRIVNPLGQQTRYTYDNGGRVTQIDQPGLATQAYQYDARGRLLQQTQGSGTVRYTWTPAGQLAGVTQPSGYKVSYTYDAAQRLIGAADNRGNTVQYTLDPLGNRLREEVRDATGAIALVTGRAIDSLNRVSAVMGAAGQATRIGYDANGEPVSETDPLNQTTRQSLDGLRRPVVTTFADNATATQRWNALDALTQVTDPKAVATVYVRNAWGEVLRETSPDAGTTVYVRDANGRVLSRTDARGVVTRITRDPLGRPVQISRGTDSNATHQTHYTWDTERPGYLARVEDPSGSTVYQRDTEGRITGKTQLVNDNPSSPSSFKAAYTYAGRELTAITYPSGLKVSYKRDATGRITAIDTKPSGTGTTAFVTGLTHTALGQPMAWRWAGGGAASRSFDADGRMTGNEFASYQYDAAGRITGISQTLDTREPPGQHASPPIWSAILKWTVGYDSRNRIVSFDREGASTQYSYDANGNRLTVQDRASAVQDIDSDYADLSTSHSTTRTHRIEPQSNRLLGFSQTQTTVQGTRSLALRTSVTFSLDAASNLTSDGLRSFDYDEANRMAEARAYRGGEEARIRYLHNALGQRVFASEPEAERTLPSQAQLGASFINWLKLNFGWLFQGAATTSIGTAYVYAEEALPSWAILGNYDNGSASGTGRSEYIWLPTQDGSAIPVGMLRNGKLYAINTDHLGTPRRMTERGSTVWQWPYSAFGDNKASGPLTATVPPGQIRPTLPVILRTTPPSQELALRFAGQFADPDTGTFYNGQRSYWPINGAFTQYDPIGRAGGLNGFAYVGGNPMSGIDPTGLVKICINGVCTDTSPPMFPPNPDYPHSPDPAPLAWPKLLPDEWVDRIIEWCTESRGRGERGATGGSSGKGTDNPYKHCRNHPTDPNKIICKDHQTGKTVEKKKPADWPG